MIPNFDDWKTHSFWETMWQQKNEPTTYKVGPLPVIDGVITPTINVRT